MSYNLLDASLKEWSSKRSIVLLSEDGYPKRRYFYRSSEPNETFQIVIEPEVDGVVRVDAHLIESVTDEELHIIIEATVPRLTTVLDMIWVNTDYWFAMFR